VLSFGQAEKEGIHIKFAKYLMIGFPLVVLNAAATFAILWLRYGGKP
jgi:Na+/H+ antiporter NhaD/arsenite permease-like protein